MASVPTEGKVCLNRARTPASREVAIEHMSGRWDHITSLYPLSRERERVELGCGSTGGLKEACIVRGGWGSEAKCLITYRIIQSRYSSGVPNV